MGMLLSGEMTLVVSGAPRRLAPNEIYLVPGGVRHAAKAGPGGAVALDAFAPPREEYK
jgi:quercetin dioxygenase-like cupin family protein